MAFVLDKVSEDTFYENILLGLTKILEKNSRIKNVCLERHAACSSSEVVSWEQMHCMRMPDDLRDFYLATNGFKLNWSYVFSEQETLQVGELHVSTLGELVPLAGYKMYTPAEIKQSRSMLSLHMGAESKAFQLSVVDENMKVGLVYLTPRSTPSIWLVDTELNWHFLSNNFRKYMCMAIAHLGLPSWQLCFTPEGIPSWVEQMFIMTVPHLPVAKPVEYGGETKSRDDHADLPNYSLNKLDINVFKSKIRVTAKAADMLKYRKKH